MTIYCYFQNRHEVMMHEIFHELHELIDVISERVAGAKSFAEFLVETFAVTHERLSFSRILSLEMREKIILMSRIYSDFTEKFLAIVRMYFRPRFEAASAGGELCAGFGFNEFMGWITHVGSGFVLAPLYGCDSNGLRQMLWRYLVPSIVCESAIPE